jgi:hypothetical protein
MDDVHTGARYHQSSVDDRNDSVISLAWAGVAARAFVFGAQPTKTVRAAVEPGGWRTGVA